MLKISIQTARFAKNNDELDGFLALVKAAGIDGVDFPLYAFQNKENPRFFDKPLDEIIEILRPLKEALDRHGLSVCQTHSPFPTYKPDDEDFNAYQVRAHRKCCDLTRYLGCDLMVVHPAHHISMTPKEQKEKSITLYSALIEDAKRTGVTILLENMWARRGGAGSAIFDSACADADEAVDYIDTLNAMAGEELFGYCFDVGHASLCGKNMRNFLCTLGSRVKALHIHDTNRIDDTHTIPYSFCTTSGMPMTDWEGMLAGLREIGYRGVINFEAATAFVTYPKPLYPALLHMFCAIGRYFSDEIEK